MLSPHQDDETIGCGLLMAEKARRGERVTVAVATDGRGGWYSPEPRPTPDDIVSIRHLEWHRALDALGVPPADRVEFGFPDGALPQHEAELVDRILEILELVRPSQIFVTRPGDPHPDHRSLVRAVGTALLQAEGAAAASSPRVFTYRVYPGEGVWPQGRPSHVGPGATIRQLARSLMGLSHGRPLLLRARRVAPVKATAIDCYESQQRLLAGELRYVWDKGVELYWPMEMPLPSG